MNSQPLILFYDLETVVPALQNPTGLIDKEGHYKVDPYQIHAARIWQMGFVCQYGEYEAFIHPGFSVENLSESSAKFLKTRDKKTLSSIPEDQNMRSIWPSFCEWLEEHVGESRTIVLVAQQLHHNDEITLAVEMARHGLEWPKGFTVLAIEALPYIQKSFKDQNVERKRPWGVAAVYKDFMGRDPEAIHRALDDARTLKANIQGCWGLQMLQSLGFQCTLDNLPVLGHHVQKMEWMFWLTVPNCLDWKMRPPKDNRQSIWSLVTSPTRMIPWPHELALILERDYEIYSISDLVERGRNHIFEESLKQSNLSSHYINLIKKELENRKSRNDSKDKPFEVIQ